MPTYDYVCRACGHEFELFQQMSDPVKRKCPRCGKAKLERLIGTGAGVLFKGGGFYETDYRSDSYRKAAEADKKGADSKDGKGDAAAKPVEGGKEGAAKSDTAPGDKAATPSTEPAAAESKAPTKPASSRRSASKRSRKK